MQNRHKKWKTLLSLLMCGIMLMGCTASKTRGPQKDSLVMENEGTRAVSISFLGGQDVMPITGYVGPYQHAYSVDGNVFPNYITDEYYKMISEVGINLIVSSFTDYADAPKAIEKCLELAGKYGVGMFVTDRNVTRKTEQDEITVEEVAKQIMMHFVECTW